MSHTCTLKSYYQHFPITNTVELRPSGSTLHVSFKLKGAIANFELAPSISMQAPKRGSELWQHSCFEIFFFDSASPQYFEVNLSPSGEWDVFAFSDYRKAAAQSFDPQISNLSTYNSNSEFVLNCSLELPRSLDLRVSPTIILEDTNAKQDFFALAHGSDRPDFHRLLLVKDLALLLRSDLNDDGRN